MIQQYENKPLTTLWHNISASKKKGAMKPQQNQDTKGTSHVYVQKPNGEELDIPAGDPQELAGKPDEATSQTAENTPTTHSSEVTSGEDA
jgi:hypothetical protein